MHRRASLGRAVSLIVAGGCAAAAFAACVEPPPKIAAIPPSGMSLRVYAFGASAQEARNAFEAARQTNKSLRIVNDGGDGEVLVGLENDSPKCVAPTALCSFKVAYRIRDNEGKVVHMETTTVTASAERCADLCEKALNSMVVKVIEAAAAALKPGEGDPDAGDDPQVAATDPGDATADKPPAKKAATKPASGGEPAICVVAHGPNLPPDEAEKRAAQVEALKRLEVLDQQEYDCLRKAYLDRL